MKCIAGFSGSWRELTTVIGTMVLVGCGGSGSSSQQPRTLITPAITSVSPSYDFSGGPSLAITVTGTGFDSTSTIHTNSGERTTTFVSSTQLTSGLTAADVAQPSTINITVANGDGQISSPFSFKVMDPAKSAIHAVSVKTDGTQDAIESQLGGYPWISGDGRYVAFTLFAPVLGLDQDTTEQAFVRDTCNSPPAGCQPSTTLVAIYPDGTVVNDSSNGTRADGISSDGRFASFDTDFKVFLRDTCAGASQTCVPQTFPVSDVPGGPTTGNHIGFGAAVSGNGRYVSFQWNPGNGNDTVYVTDTCAGVGGPCTPSTQEVAFANDGTFVGGDSSALSADGRYVAFQGGQNPDGNTYVRDLCNGVSTGCTQQNIWVGTGGFQSMSPDGRYLSLMPSDGQVYVQDTCIGAAGGCAPTMTMASVADDGTPANFYSEYSSVTANGRFVAFTTCASNLVPNDTNSNDLCGVDVFVRDTCIGADAGCTPQTVRIDLAADGSQAELPIDPYVVISADGGYTAFDGQAQLVPGLLPNSDNVFIVRNGAYLSTLDRASSTRRFDQREGIASSKANKLNQ